MKKALARTIILSISLGVLVFAALNSQIFWPKTVRAFGELLVDFHVPVGAPIFTVNNMAPGDSQNKNVDVNNSGSLARIVSVKGIKTAGVGGDPKIETILDIVIKDGATPVYGTGSVTGAKTLANFFAESNSVDGVQLSLINPGGNKTYNFKVTFPTSAGNEYQGKSVTFDLTFGVINNLVINEVFYQVDGSHGLDSPKDRGVVVVSNGNINISGNGAGSKNIVNLNLSQICNTLQTNNTTAINNILSNSNSGGNKVVGNTGLNTGVFTATSSSNVVTIVQGALNNLSADCAKKMGQNDEWIEIYNPTSQDISLKNWTLTDNSNNATFINPNKIIKAGGFALISKDASLWGSWNENLNAIKIELGSQIGDGLDNLGDHVFLKDPNGQLVDAVSWGSDTAAFNPSVPLVGLGHSIERKSPGFDSNLASDFLDRINPTPGN